MHQSSSETRGQNTGESWSMLYRNRLTQVGHNDSGNSVVTDNLQSIHQIVTDLECFPKRQLFSSSSLPERPLITTSWTQSRNQLLNSGCSFSANYNSATIISLVLWSTIIQLAMQVITALRVFLSKLSWQEGVQCLWKIDTCYLIWQWHLQGGTTFDCKMLPREGSGMKPKEMKITFSDMDVEFFSNFTEAEAKITDNCSTVLLPRSLGEPGIDCIVGRCLRIQVEYFCRLQHDHWTLNIASEHLFLPIATTLAQISEY